MLVFWPRGFKALPGEPILGWINREGNIFIVKDSSGDWWTEDTPMNRTLRNFAHGHGEEGPAIITDAEGSFMALLKSSHQPSAECTIHCTLVFYENFHDCNLRDDPNPDSLVSQIKLAHKFGGSRRRELDVHASQTFNMFYLLFGLINSLIRWLPKGVGLERSRFYCTLHKKCTLYYFASRKSESNENPRVKQALVGNLCTRTVLDIFTGILVASFIYTHSETISERYNEFVLETIVEEATRFLVWLMNWPAGFKLNGKMVRFLGELFMWLLSLWTQLSVATWAEYTPWFIAYVLPITCLFGCSTALSLILDFINFTVSHLKFLYFVACKIFNWQTVVLSSLFNLFRGKKWNVLRERTDSADYDLDQLLLGTIIFTMLVYILPTTLFYYVVFSAIHLGLLLLLRIGDTLLVVLDEFPWYDLYKRHVNPYFMANRLIFDEEEVAGEDGSPIAVIRPEPKSYSTIMAPLFKSIRSKVTSVFNGENARFYMRGIYINLDP